MILFGSDWFLEGGFQALFASESPGGLIRHNAEPHPLEILIQWVQSGAHIYICNVFPDVADTAGPWPHIETTAGN